MAKKRKVGADEVVLQQVPLKKIKTTFTQETANAEIIEAGNGATEVFRNKEKVLVLCSRGITFRLVLPGRIRIWHLCWCSAVVMVGLITALAVTGREAGTLNVTSRVIHCYLDFRKWFYILPSCEGVDGFLRA
jgi:selenophosphate synthetase-related protein